MDGNKEEAQRCLSIAQRHRSSSNLPSALKFARKSVTLFSTPQGEAMITIIEREIETGGSASGSNMPNGTGATAGRASGVEEHVTSAHSRPGRAAGGGGGEKPKKREYTVQQMEVVKRVKGCKHHEYYEILSLEKTCAENDVKKAYKKLALALHPDKNGAPGADEAFKMVSKAFQVLSDISLRSAFDSNPIGDPAQRNTGVSGRGGGGMHPGFANGGFQGEINPEDLFNMFFGGGGGGFGGQANVFTFGGRNGFQAQYRRPRTNDQPDTPTSPWVALLPLLVLFLFAAVSILPSLFSDSVADPEFAWDRGTKYDSGRNTWHRGVQYYVNRAEWEGSSIWQSVPEERRHQVDAAMYSNKVRTFERNVESYYIRKLENECEYFHNMKQQRIAENAGFFGIGADYEKLAEIRASKSPACDQLKAWGHQRTKTHNF